MFFISVGRLNPKDFYFLYVGSLGMCWQTQIVFRSTLSRQCKSLKGGTQCMRGSPLHFPFSIFYGIVSDLPVECEKSIFWMHFYLSFTRGRGQGKSSALSWQMYLTIFGWHCKLLNADCSRIEAYTLVHLGLVTHNCH